MNFHTNISNFHCKTEELKHVLLLYTLGIQIAEMILTPAVYTVNTLTHLNDLCEGICYLVQGCQGWTLWTLSFLWPRQISKSAECKSASLGWCWKLEKVCQQRTSANLLWHTVSSSSLLFTLYFTFQRDNSNMYDFEIWADICLLACCVICLKEWTVYSFFLLYGTEFWVFIFRFCKHSVLCNMNSFQA